MATSFLARGECRILAVYGGQYLTADVTYRTHGTEEPAAAAARNLVLVTSPEQPNVEKAAVQQPVHDVSRHLAHLRALADAPDTRPEARAKIDNTQRIEAQYEPVAIN